MAMFWRSWAAWEGGIHLVLGHGPLQAPPYEVAHLARNVVVHEQPGLAPTPHLVARGASPLAHRVAYGVEVVGLLGDGRADRRGRSLSHGLSGRGLLGGAPGGAVEGG